MELDGVRSVEPDAGAFFAASRKLRGLVGTAGASLNARPLVRGLSSPTQSFVASPSRPQGSPGRR